MALKLHPTLRESQVGGVLSFRHRRQDAGGSLSQPAMMAAVVAAVAVAAAVMTAKSAAVGLVAVTVAAGTMSEVATGYPNLARRSVVAAASVAAAAPPLVCDMPMVRTAMRARAKLRAGCVVQQLGGCQRPRAHGRRL
jgi:hypothetical protein